MADCGHLSDAEAGLYLRLLMVMWRAPEQRIPNDDEWLGKRFGKDQNQTINLIRPLIREFCTCDGNWITQKRLTKEWEYVKAASLRHSAAAKSRWEKQRATSNSIAASHVPSNAPTPTPTPTLKKEELRSSKESLPEGFDLFWAAYPRHVAKPKAVKAYKAAVLIAAPAEIIAGVRAFKFSRDPEYQPHPATWLNQRRWQDETPQPELPRFIPGAI